MPRSAVAPYPYNSRMSKPGDKLPDQLKLMSPFHDGNKPPPLPGVSFGNFVTTNNIQRISLATDTALGKLIIFNPSIRGAVNTLQYHSNGTIVTGSANNSTLYKYRDGAGETQPVSHGCLKAGCRLKCTSNGNKREGIVRILNTTSAVELLYSTDLNLTTACINSLVDSVKVNPKSRSYTAESLTDEHTLIGFPSTFSAYTGYGNTEFNGADSDPEIKNQFAQALKDMPMSAILIYFEPTSVSIEYEIVLCSTDKMRFKADTVLGSLAKSAFVDKSGRTEKAHKAIEESGSDLHKLDSTPSSIKPASSSFTASPGAQGSSGAKIQGGVIKRGRKSNAQKAAEAEAAAILARGRARSLPPEGTPI